MPKNSRSKPIATPPPSVGEVYALTKQLAEELDQAMHGTATDRDELMATAGSQLAYLQPIVDTLARRADARELVIAQRASVLFAQDEPPGATTQPGQLAMQLALALKRYLAARPQDRDRLSTSCHLVFCDVYAQLSALLIADRAEREDHVWYNTELAPALSQGFSAAMREIFGKRQSRGRGRTGSNSKGGR